MTTKNVNYSPFEDERPRPATVEAVREAAEDCWLDPARTPRSNQARLLFSLYHCVGLPFPYGWREASVMVLGERGIPATTLSLDVLHSAMLTDAVLDFDGWPGIDGRLIRDLLERQRPSPPGRSTAPLRPRTSQRRRPRAPDVDSPDVERVVAAVGDRPSARAVARTMVSMGLTGRRNLALARAVCLRLGLEPTDESLVTKLKPSAR